MPGSAWPAAPTLTPGVNYYSQEPPRSGTNGFAIAGFVLGLLSVIPLSVIFGIIALVKIGKRPQRGKGLAIAGLCLSGVWLVGLIAVIAVSAQTASRSSSTGQITKNGHLSVLSLRPGDCFQNPSGLQPSDTLTQVTAVSCATPHNAQVIALLPVSGSAYPGEAAFKAQATTGCKTAATNDLDKAKLTESMNLLWLYPEPDAWAGGQHSISCLVVDSTADLTSSLMK